LTTTGSNPRKPSTKVVNCVVLCIVCVYCVLLPLGVNPIAVNKYIDNNININTTAFIQMPITPPIPLFLMGISFFIYAHFFQNITMADNNGYVYKFIKINKNRKL
jgi:hypothetical protein